MEIELSNQKIKILKVSNRRKILNSGDDVRYLINQGLLTEVDVTEDGYSESCVISEKGREALYTILKKNRSHNFNMILSIISLIVSISALTVSILVAVYRQ